MKVRGLVGGMTTMMAHTFVFIVVKTYPLLVKHVDRHGAFLLYGFISVIGILLARLCAIILQYLITYYSHNILLFLLARDKGKNTSGDRRLFQWTHFHTKDKEG